MRMQEAKKVVSLIQEVAMSGFNSHLWAAISSSHTHYSFPPSGSCFSGEILEVPRLAPWARDPLQAEARCQF